MRPLLLWWPHRAERIFGRPHDRPDAIVFGRERDEPRHVVGRRDVVGVEARRVGICRVVEAQVVGLLVHPGDETVIAERRDARQRARRGVVGRNQQQVQQIGDPNAIVRAQIGRRRAQRVGAGDRDFLVEVGRRLEEHDRGHHFRDAGDRALVHRVFFVEHLAGGGVVNNGGGGADIRHDVARVVGAERGCLGFGERPGRSAGFRAGGADARSTCPGTGRGRRLGLGCRFGSRRNLTDRSCSGRGTCASGAGSRPATEPQGERYR